MPGVNPFATEEQWKAAGSPGGDYSAWLKSIGYDASGNPVASGTTPSEPLYNADGSSKNGALGAQQKNADGGVSPQSFEQRLAAGEFSGNEAQATQLEVRRRRNVLSGEGMQPLPADVADLVMRDSSGKVRKARSATTQNALGAAFDSKASLFGAR